MDFSVRFSHLGDKGIMLSSAGIEVGIGLGALSSFRRSQIAPVVTYKLNQLMHSSSVQ